MVKYDNEHWETLMRTVIERIGVKEFLRIGIELIEEVKDEYPKMADQLRDVTNKYIIDNKNTCPNTGLPCLDGCDGINCMGLHTPLNEWPTSGKEKGELSFMQSEAMKLKR